MASCSIVLIPYHCGIPVVILLVWIVCSHPVLSRSKKSLEVAESPLISFFFFFQSISISQPLLVRKRTHSFPYSSRTSVSLLVRRMIPGMLKNTQGEKRNETVTEVNKSSIPLFYSIRYTIIKTVLGYLAEWVKAHNNNNNNAVFNSGLTTLWDPAMLGQPSDEDSTMIRPEEDVRTGNASCSLLLTRSR